MNNFKEYESIDTQIKDRYLLKLAPDFSVFDTAEKVLSTAENNISHGVFGRWEGTTINTPFRRGIFKVFDKEAAILSTDAIYSTYTIGNDDFLYIIALDDQANISFTFNKQVCLIGVAF